MITDNQKVANRQKLLDNLIYFHFPTKYIECMKTEFEEILQTQCSKSITKI